MGEQLEFQFECERGVIGVAGAQLEFQLGDFVRIPWSGIVRMLNAEYESNCRDKQENVDPDTIVGIDSSHEQKLNRKLNELLGIKPKTWV